MCGNSIFSSLHVCDEYENPDFVPVRQNEQQETAMKALESLCENSKDEAQVLTALRSVTAQIYLEYAKLLQK